jgi:hypothetical protein
LPSVGLEPTRRMTPVPKTGTSTNSVTKANLYYIIINKAPYFKLHKSSFSISNVLFLFFIFFCLGNFFGLLIKTTPYQIHYLFIIILLSELISYLNLKLQKFKFFYYLNICKRGFLIGIFVEAFKVGS